MSGSGGDEAELIRRDLDALERRADAADSRAGLLLAVAGLLASLGGVGGWAPLALSARFFAGLAALAAVGALSVEIADPTAADTDLSATARKQRAKPSGLAADIDRYDHESKYFRIKLARLRLTSRLVTAALAFAVLGATVEAATIG